MTSETSSVETVETGPRATSEASGVSTTEPSLPVRKGSQRARQIAVVGVWPIVLLTGVLATLLNPDTFLTTNNLKNILIQSSVLGILVVGESLVLLGRNFDLSLGATLGLCATVAAWLMAGSDPGSGLALSPLLAVPAMLVLGGLVGAANAFFVVKLKINAFIATLGMLILLQGLSLALTSGQSIFGLPEGFTALGSNEIAGLPLAALAMLGTFVVASIVLRYRTYGRHLYATGGDPRVAFAAGIRTDRVVTISFIAAGVLAALAGWLLAGRLEASVAGMGQGLIFDVFAAAVIGGISLQGGRGSLMNALGGVLLLGVIGNMLTLAQVSPFWVDAVRGGLILLAMCLDVLRRRLEEAAVAAGAGR